MRRYCFLNIFRKKICNGFFQFKNHILINKMSNSNSCSPKQRLFPGVKDTSSADLNKIICKFIKFQVDGKTNYVLIQSLTTVAENKKTLIPRKYCRLNRWSAKMNSYNQIMRDVPDFLMLLEKEHKINIF